VVCKGAACAAFDVICNEDLEQVFHLFANWRAIIGVEESTPKAVNWERGGFAAPWRTGEQ
jgi:hypothetical protein